MYRRAVTGEEQKALLTLHRKDGTFCNAFVSLIPLHHEPVQDEDLETKISRPVEWIVGFLAEEPESHEHVDEKPFEADYERVNTDLKDEHNTIHFVSSRGIVQYVSRSVEYLLGYRQEEIVGRHVEEFCDPNDIVALLRELKEIKNSRGHRSADSGSDDGSDMRLRRTAQSKMVHLGDSPTMQMVLAEVHGILRMHHRNSTVVWMEIVGRLVLQPSGSGRKSRTVVAVTCRPRDYVRKAAAEATVEAAAEAAAMHPMPPPVMSQSSSPVWLAVSPTGVILQCIVQGPNGFHKACSHDDNGLLVRVGYSLPSLMNQEAMMVVQRLIRQKFRAFSIPHWIGNTPVVTTWVPITQQMQVPKLSRLGATILVRLESQQYGFDHVPNIVFEPDLSQIVLPRDATFVPTHTRASSEIPQESKMWWEAGDWARRSLQGFTSTDAMQQTTLPQSMMTTAAQSAAPLFQSNPMVNPFSVTVPTVAPDSTIMMTHPAFNVKNNPVTTTVNDTAIPTAIPLEDNPSVYPFYNAPGSSAVTLADAIPPDLAVSMPAMTSLSSEMGNVNTAQSGEAMQTGETAQALDMMSSLWSFDS
ncbi:hypothetical protein MCUN1_002950 [Malassezia cuniculi]|uniref:PAS domain-containing protein n=1 Tax=Malassezia cuniculi TaxID=948313 RepID=A0AAF0EX01_9BASI|nr:hypothetical protein MCUN1_002950 [Malassezia cuniculi]